MIAAEFDRFVELVRKLEKLYGKTIDDETMQMYWGALKELPFATIERKINDHIKRAKFFPKPVELRPKEEASGFEQSEKSRREFEQAVERNKAFWDEELRADPIGTKWKLLDAYLARISVQEQPSSIIYAERFKFAQEVCRELVRITGLEYVAGNTHLMHTVSRLLGGQALKQCVDIDYARRHAGEIAA
jgi:hypothetical protein